MVQANDPCFEYRPDRTDIPGAVIRVFERLGWATRVRRPVPDRLAARSSAGQVSPRSPPHSQGSQGNGAEKHDDPDDQQVQQALGDHADNTQRDRRYY
jgi:hypothetical protein